MPEQSGQSNLFAKLGNRLKEAHDAVKSAPVEFNQFSELPPGIENGVAVLDSIKFGTYGKGDNVGEIFCMFQGIVESPEVAPNGQRVRGLRTKIGPLPLCDTVIKTGPNKGKTIPLKDHLKVVENELKKFKLQVDKIPAEMLQEAALALAKSKPKFMFRTWQGKVTEEYPNPRVNHEWLGVATVVPANGQAPAVKDSSPTVAEPAPSFNDIDPPAAEASPDLDTLVARAKEEDQDAKDQLTDLAVKAGWDENEANSAESWDEVAEMVRNPKGEEEPAAPWSVNDMADYTAPDPKNKGKFLKPARVEVVAVDVAKKTADVKNLANSKVSKGVSFDRLAVPQS